VELLGGQSLSAENAHCVVWFFRKVVVTVRQNVSSGLERSPAARDSRFVLLSQDEDD